jgi:hypothetical protein
MGHSPSDSSRVAGAKAWGYLAADGSPCLQYCHVCQLENYTLNITTGRCTWCGAGPSEPVQVPGLVSVSEAPTLIS